MKQIIHVCVLILASTLFACVKSKATDFYVATNGLDSNPGTIDRPFATLEAVRTAIRGLRAPLTNAVTVYLRGGRYFRQSTFALTYQDSGTPSAPIVYKNYADEVPYIIGGINVTGFQAVTDAAILTRLTPPAKTNVLVADLTAQGATNLGTLTNHGYGHSLYDQNELPFQSELLFQDHSMTLARWPNTNWLTITAQVTTNSFAYVGTNPAAWADVQDIWAHGYWSSDYADSLEQVVSINTTNHIVTLNYPGANYSSYKAGQRFYFFNVLEELDYPGEYYIDRSNSKLYFWPPNPITNDGCIVSIATNLVTLTAVSNVAFSGITFEAGKSILFLIAGGQSNQLENCSFKGGSADAVKMLHSSGSSVTYCSITDMGERGVWIYGSGTRSNLVSGNNSISCNTISNVSRLCRTYKPAIDLSHTYYLVSENVVGVYIGHNVIHDLPHQAIMWFGNNNVIEYNEIYRVCTETADAGAIYASYDWTFRGNIIRYNYLHDIHIGGGATDYTGVVGVYLDLLLSGTTVFGNIFCAVDHGILMGGGRDNIIQNNIFVDCTNTTPLASCAIAVDQRGLGYMASDIANTNGTMQTRLRSMPYQTPPWSQQYPALVTILTNNSGGALGNIISTNISYNCLVWTYWENNANTNVTVTNNFTNGDPLFADYPHRDFSLLTNSPVWQLGFQPIPLGGFGLLFSPPSRLEIQGVH